MSCDTKKSSKNNFKNSLISRIFHLHLCIKKTTVLVGLFCCIFGTKIWLFICCKVKLKKKILVFFTKYTLFAEKNVFIRKKKFYIEKSFYWKKPFLPIYIEKIFYWKKTFFTEKKYIWKCKKDISHLRNNL